MVEFQVLRCAKCKTFQVTQVTKSPKWKCKLCAEKQSLLKNYGRGTGADCRRHVQKLNSLQGQIDETTEEKCLVSQHSFSNNVKSNVNHEENDTSSDYKCLRESRWSHYMEVTSGEATPGVDNIHCPTTNPHLTLSTSDVPDFYKKNMRKRSLKRNGSPEKSTNKFQEISEEFIGINSLRTNNSIQWKRHRDNTHPISSISQTDHHSVRNPGPRWTKPAVKPNTGVKAHESPLQAKSAAESNKGVKSPQSPLQLSSSDRSVCLNSKRQFTLQGSSLKGQADLSDHHPVSTESFVVRSNQMKGQTDNLKCVATQICKDIIIKQSKQKNLSDKVSLKWAAFIESDPSEEDDDEDDFRKADGGPSYPIVVSRSVLNNCLTKWPAEEMNHVSTGTWQDHVNQSAGETIQHFIYKSEQNPTSSVVCQGDYKSEGVNFDLGYYDTDSFDF